ncbi:vitamin D3 receptor B-like [Amphiura filiformis]|uniref:vitamin D3 receptor B-like n=1 Tax=Amphiura filiformis TaxID=82378 RepID=UPI003B216A23
MNEKKKSEVDALRQRLALERKMLEDERKKLELERKKQEDDFLRLKEEFYRKQEMEEREKNEVESLRLQLDNEKQRLEDERKQLKLDKEQQEYEYQKIQEQFKRKTHLGQEHRVPDIAVHSTQGNDDEQVVSTKKEKLVPPKTSDVRFRTNGSRKSPGKSLGKSTKLPINKSNMICVVCGEKANGMHFKALTCEGCKVFFRRNSKKQDSLKCHSDTGIKGQCEMDLYTRRHCAYCRMRKCLEVGMELGRVWDKERCKTRKQIKKPVITPTEVTSEDDDSAASSPTSSSKPDLTEEQKQLMTLVDEAFVNAMKIRQLPNGTSATLTDIRKNSSQIFHVKGMHESEIATALFGTMGSLTSEHSSLGPVTYVPSYFTQSMSPSNGAEWASGLFAEDISAQDSRQTDEVEDEIAFDPDMFKHFMEIIVIGLKELIAFLKALPGFNDLSCEDQAALCKETFAEFMVLKTATFYEVEQKAFCTAICGERYLVSDMKMAGFTEFLKSLLPFAEKIAKLRFSREEHRLLCAICILTPDRHVLSDEAKLSISPHHERLIELLCACGHVHHSDQPQFFPKVVGLLTQLRDCTESFMSELRRLKLEGQSMQPILGEIFEM